MKTFDGYETKKHGYYYLVDGQCVCLLETVTKEDNSQAFLVVMYYEGEGMTVDGAGGQHNEHTFDFEIEGEPILVDCIFKSAPTEKLCSTYKENLLKVQESAKTFAELNLAGKKLSRLAVIKENELKMLEVKIKGLERKVTLAEETVKAIFQ